MAALYGEDLAYIHAAGFADFARAASPEIIRRLRSAGIAVRRVIDIGCGAGQLSAALTAAGFEVTGIEPSTALLALARAMAPSARFLNGSVYEIELPACDAIIALGEPLTYHDRAVDADARVADFFRRASGVLPPGGLLIFDVIELGEPPLNGRSWASGVDWAVLAETLENRSTRTLERRIETFRRVDHLYRRRQEVHNVRLFDSNELERRLTGCGFRVESASSYGDYPLPPRRRAFFARKTE